MRATTLDAAVREVVDLAARRRPTAVHLANAFSVVCAHANSGVLEALSGRDLSFMDGVPLVWIAKALGARGCGRVYGPDLMLAVMDRGRAYGLRHYLYGGSPSTLSLLTDNLVSRFPGLEIVGAEAPPFRPLTSAEADSAKARIRSRSPHVVWVGIGTPKQDLLCHEWLETCDSVMVAVGAAFDFHAGVKRQAPALLQRAGLEWLFRLITEPRRLAGRYLIGNVRFLLLVARRARLRRAVPASAAAEDSTRKAVS